MSSLTDEAMADAVGDEARAKNALIAAAKKELRARLRRLRKALPSEPRAERAERIRSFLLGLPEWTAARTVMLFAPMPTEVNVEPLFEEIWSSGKTLVLSRMADAEDGQANPDLRLHLHRRGDSLCESRWGIREPEESAALANAESIDLVIVPALAIDGSGARLGYGGGYYDRLLPRLKNATRVAVVFDFQLMAELPCAPYDERVHAAVTDRSVLRF